MEVRLSRDLIFSKIISEINLRNSLAEVEHTIRISKKKELYEIWKELKMNSNKN